MSSCVTAKVEKEPVIINEDTAKDDKINKENGQADKDTGASENQESPSQAPTDETTPGDTSQNEADAQADEALISPAPSDEISDKKEDTNADTYEDTINLEGMDETVNYTNYTSDMGFKISYDNERFTVSEDYEYVSFMASNPDPSIYPYVFLNISRYDLPKIANISDEQREESHNNPNYKRNEADKIYWYVLPVKNNKIHYAQIKGSDSDVIDTIFSEDINGHTAFTYTIKQGKDWNSAVRKYYFITLDSYVYKIEIQYFVEAEEGFGTRLQAMVKTLSFE